MENLPSNIWDPVLYDAEHAYVWRFGGELVDLLAPKSGERILDVGCGTGHLTARIAAAGADVVGLDNSSSMVEQARNTYPSIEFVVADASDFALKPPFDAVFSNATLHWVKCAEEAVECIARALKPAGRFVAEMGGKGNVATIVTALTAARSGVGLATSKDMNPWYFPSLGEYSALVERHGLTVTFATLFERPTPLSGTEGLRSWLEMYADTFFAGLTPEQRQAVLQKTEEYALPSLYKDGGWVADYQRLRLVAVKSQAARR